MSTVLLFERKPHCVSGTISGVMWLESLFSRIRAKILPAAERRDIPRCIVVHVMKAACKYVEVQLAFAGYQQHSLGGLTVVLHRQECIQTDVDH